MAPPYILAIDQGTTGTTTVLFDRTGRAVARAYREVRQIYPRPGWVEHDPEDIWRTVLDTVAELPIRTPSEVAALGLTNQRETTILWEAASGRPLHNAIVWQCRRTAAACEALQAHAPLIRQKTGLPVDAYFSGTKIRWLLDSREGDAPLQAAAPSVPGDRRPALADLRCGTVDSWLMWKLTGGRVHATDYTNASRTLLFDIHMRRWDPELCRLLGVPLEILPEARPSIGEFGAVTAIPALAGVPIRGVAGDQQAALFGQTCFAPGQSKNTYGTGCFLLMNTGARAVASEYGLLTTLAVDGAGRPCYALEGAVFIAGAAIQWLRDELRLLGTAAESEEAARAVPDNGGVYLVPAFAGLGAPHWDMAARGTLVGLTRGTQRNHLIRAAVEAMAYQTADVLTLMEQETGMRLPALAVDGGAAANNFLMQFQADILNRPVVRPRTIESTALGAAYLAGLGAGYWPDAAALTALRAVERTFTSAMPDDERQRLIAGWAKALRQTMTP